MTSNCLPCRGNARIGSLPPREEVVVEGGWRVAHAFDTSLPGWLVVLPMLHVEALHQLPAENLAALGPLLGRLSAGLQRAVGAEKTYVVFFAEKEGFEHVHLHVIPRMPWFAHEHQGPRVFAFLGVPESDAVSEAERDAVALTLRSHLAES